MTTIRIEPLTNPEQAAAPQPLLQSPSFALPQRLTLPAFEEALMTAFQRWSIPALRITLGLVFLWFGVLKLAGLSPVVALVQQTYWFLPFQPLFTGLGICELVIGCGLLSRRALRGTLVLLWLHMAGTLLALALAPTLFFSGGNPLQLTMEGEFVVKNLVLISASFVIGGYELKPRGFARG